MIFPSDMTAECDECGVLITVYAVTSETEVVLRCQNEGWTFFDSVIRCEECSNKYLEEQK